MHRPFSKRPDKAIAGLDLDPAHIAAAVGAKSGGVQVERSAVAPLAPGVLRDGEVTDPEALTGAIRELWAEHDLPRRVRLGVANQRIVVRTLDLPPLTDPAAIASAVAVEAPDQIPMPMEEAITDHHTIGVVNTVSGPRTRVVVVAVRREMINRYVEAVGGAGLEVVGIDLSAFALVRALVGEGEPDGAIFINAAGLTNVAIVHGKDCVFTRAAAGGLDSMAQSLSQRCSLTTEHALMWLSHVGLEQPLSALEGDPQLIGAARTTLEEGVHQLADTVRNSLNFFRMQQNSSPVSRAVLSGPVAAVPGLPDALQAKLDMPLDVRGVAGDGPSDEGMGSRFVVAAGLTVATG